MFYRDDKYWYYYSYARKNWVNAGSIVFTADLSDRFAAETTTDAKPEVFSSLPDGALPAFSGSKILCVGRNYRKHAEELGNDVPARPLWFF